MSRYNPALLKLELLVRGIKFDTEVAPQVGNTLKEPWRQRAASGAGIDLVLERQVYVCAPVEEYFCQNSPFLLTIRNGQTVIAKNGDVVQRVKIFPRPSYYGRKTSDGTSMQRIGVTTGDYVGITFDNRCWFWGHYSERTLLEHYERECKYCSIGLNLDTTEEYRKSIRQILEVCEAALQEWNCQHVALNAGTFPPPGRGHEEYAEVISAIKSKFDIWVRLSIAPPDEERYVDLLFDAGADFVGYNYEVFDPELYRYICPGKYDEIDKGKAHQQYDRILRRAVEKGGKNKVYSILIAGLEPKERTVAGIEHLASMGVVPRVLPFRALVGTPFERHPMSTVEELVYIYRKLNEITNRYGVDTGCAACSRIEVGTKEYLGINPVMPEIGDQDLIIAGIDPDKVR